MIDGPQYEQLIDEKYLNTSNSTVAWRLESYRATGNVSSSNTTVPQQLRCYFVTKCIFPEQTKPILPGGKVDIRDVSDKVFLEKTTENTLKLYQDAMDEALKR